MRSPHAKKCYRYSLGLLWPMKVKRIERFSSGKFSCSLHHTILEIKCCINPFSWWLTSYPKFNRCDTSKHFVYRQHFSIGKKILLCSIGAETSGRFYLLGFYLDCIQYKIHNVIFIIIRTKKKSIFLLHYAKSWVHTCYGYVIGSNNNDSIVDFLRFNNKNFFRFLYTFIQIFTKRKLLRQSYSWLRAILCELMYVCWFIVYIFDFRMDLSSFLLYAIQF